MTVGSETRKHRNRNMSIDMRSVKVDTWMFPKIGGDFPPKWMVYNSDINQENQANEHLGNGFAPWDFTRDDISSKHSVIPKVTSMGLLLSYKYDWMTNSQLVSQGG